MNKEAKISVPVEVHSRAHSVRQRSGVVIGQVYLYLLEYVFANYDDDALTHVVGTVDQFHKANPHALFRMQ